MKHFAYSILGCLLLSLNAAFAQKTWSFDGQDPYSPVTASHC